ncbi:hypothetical protein RO575_22710 [Methylomonas sp. MO1]|uniref:hypothetical protein n=1 Tax=Methylomonas sp. MO1 TaxID=3073619 RepID=UPI0028A31B7E|nr:hypothetical protein [Methylomonas sp. MO1]MDT4292387.1 hypothetical protein [Methylomonas sp. MO1]
MNNNPSQAPNEHQLINGSAFHIALENHNKALHLLEEIKRQSGGLVNQKNRKGFAPQILRRFAFIG